MIHKIYWLVVCLLLFSSNVTSQNLVPNYSFEERSGCPDALSQTDKCEDWSAFRLTPDYYHSCNSGNFSVPVTFVGYQNAATGNGIAALTTYIPTNPNYREFIGAKLTSPLIVGETYYIEFKVSLADKFKHATNIGLQFFSEFYSEESPAPINNIFHLTSETIITDKNSWVTISGNYKATYPFGYVALGNFLEDTFTTPILVQNGDLILGAYYFIDDVKVIRPLLSISGDSILCAGDSLKLYAKGGIVTGWTNSENPNLILSTSQNYFTTVTVGSTYVAVSDLDTAYFSISVNPKPEINLGEDSQLCDGDTLVLDINLDTVSYLWQDNSTDVLYTIATPGSYWVNVLDQHGCIGSDTILISEGTIPKFNLGNDSILCETDSIILRTNILNAIYKWQDSSSNNTLTAYQTGIYWLTLTNQCNSMSGSIMLDFKSLPDISIGNDTTICQGDSVLLDAFGVDLVYLWQDNSTMKLFYAKEAGLYWVKVLSIEGCENFDSVLVEVNQIPEVFLGNDTTICFHDKLTLVAPIFDGSYLWQDNSTGQEYSVVKDGTYQLIISNFCGSAWDEINVKTTICGCTLYLPNAFSPNSDNLNEVFNAKTNCSFAEFRLIIFNRWGDIQFETTNPFEGWTGTSHSISSPNGVYVFLLDYTFEDGTNGTKTGQVSLLR